MDYIIDTHSHIQFSAYDEDRAEVIKRARAAGVKMLAIGTQISTSQDGVKIANEFPEDVLGATAGFHPSHVNADEYFDANELRAGAKEEFDVDKLQKVAKNNRVLAIGECGLDYFRIKNNELGIMIKQKEIFIEQIKLAKDIDKPLVIHCRAAFHDLITILNSYFTIHNSCSGVIHFFSGTVDDARRLLNLGFYMGFGGAITFPLKADQPLTHAYDEIVKFVPLERILIETDAPYVAPVPYRGKKNEPAYVIQVAKKIAELKNISYEEVALTTLKNTRTLFRV